MLGVVRLLIFVLLLVAAAPAAEVQTFLNQYCVACHNQTLSTAGLSFASLDAANLALATEIARIPEDIRGYGHVKARHLAEAKKKEAELLSAFRNPREQPKAA